MEALDLYGSRLMRELDTLKEELLSEDDALTPLDAATNLSLENSSIEFQAMLDGMHAKTPVHIRRLQLIARVAVAAAALILATIFFLSYSPRKESGSESAETESTPPDVENSSGGLAESDLSELPEIAATPNPLSRSGSVPEPTTAMLIPCSLLFLLRRKRTN